MSFPLPIEIRRAQKAVLIFHGLTGSPLEMESLAGPLHDRGFDVFVPCLLGHCQSLEALRTTTAAQWLGQAEDLLQNIKRCGYQQVFAAGLSFGALLVAHLASGSRSLSGAVLLSPSLRLRSLFREVLLQVLSRLPDVLLDCLGFVKKRKWRPQDSFLPRESYDSHSVAAGARLVFIRRLVLRNASLLSVPLLVLQDPKDYHVLNSGVLSFRKKVACEDAQLRWLPEGRHHLTVSRLHQVVSSLVCEFFERLSADTRP